MFLFVFLISAWLHGPKIAFLYPGSAKGMQPNWPPAGMLEGRVGRVQEL